MNPYDLPVGRIEDLVEKHGTPLYIVSREKLLENYRRLDRCLPAVTLFYAVKTNQHEGILEILKNAGAGFDVASRGEIMDAVHAGANPREDLSEITQIARHAPGANVHVRIMVSNKGSVAHLSDKFGAEINEAVPLLLAARDQGLVPRGVSFHVGSQCLNPQRYVDALDQTRGVFDEAAKHGLDLEMIDIGGGFPVKYEDEKAEPGRAIVGDAVILVTKVISESVRKGKNWLYFDDGTYGSFMEVLLYQMRFPMKTNTDGPLRKYVLAGPTCDSIDVFSRDKKGRIKEVELPEMHLDDLLIAGSMGAYTYSESTRFNGFEPPAFIYID